MLLPTSHPFSLHDVEASRHVRKNGKRAGKDIRFGYWLMAPLKRISKGKHCPRLLSLNVNPHKSLDEAWDLAQLICLALLYNPVH